MERKHCLTEAQLPFETFWNIFSCHVIRFGWTYNQEEMHEGQTRAGNIRVVYIHVVGALDETVRFYVLLPERLKRQIMFCEWIWKLGDWVSLRAQKGKKNSKLILWEVAWELF